MCGYFGVTRSAYYRWLKHPIAEMKGKTGSSVRSSARSIPPIRTWDTAGSGMSWRRVTGERSMTSGYCACAGSWGSSPLSNGGPGAARGGERSAKYTAENLLAREFHAEKPNEKWVTDVTEFKYYTGTEVHKVYLSAILDLCDRRLVAYKIPKP